MTEFPKLLPTAEVSTLSGQQRQPYPDHGPTGPSKEPEVDVHEKAPPKGSALASQRSAILRAPKEGILTRAKNWFGFGRHM